MHRRYNPEDNYSHDHDMRYDDDYVEPSLYAGNTSLHFAVENRDASLIAKILYNGESLSFKNRFGYTPTQLANQNEAYECLDAIVKNYSQEKNGVLSSEDARILSFYRPVVVSASSAAAAAAAASASSSSSGRSGSLSNNRETFIRAVNEGDVATVQALLIAGVSPNIRIDKEMNTALSWSVQQENVALITLLLRNKADISIPNKSGLTPIYFTTRVARDCLKAICENYTERNNGRLKPEDNAILVQYARMASGASSSQASAIALSSAPPVQPAAKVIAPRDMYINAIMEGKPESVLNALRVGVAPDTRVDKELNTGLHQAVAQRNKQVIQLLLSNGASVNLRNRAGITPLQLAFNNNNLDCMLAISEYRRIQSGKMDEESNRIWRSIISSIQSKEETNLERYKKAVRHGDVYYVHSLLKSKLVDPDQIIDEDSNTALHYAVQYHDLSLVRVLLLRKASLTKCNHDGLTPIQLAELSGALDCLRAIADNYHHQEESLSVFDAEIIRLHRENVSDDDIKKVRKTPLQRQSEDRDSYLSCFRGDDAESKLVKYIDRLSLDELNRVVDIRINEEQYTALHCAVHLKNRNLIRTCLRAKANLSLKNNDDITPMRLAAQNNDWDSIAAIAEAMTEENGVLDQYDAAILGLYQLSKGSNALSVQGGALRNALLYLAAVQGGCVNMVFDLVEMGILPDLPVDDHLNTALHYAITNKKNDLVAYLAINGASIKVKNRNGMTPIALALQLEAWDCVDILLDKCAPADIPYEEVLQKAVQSSQQPAACAVVARLLNVYHQPNVRIDGDLNTSLHYAVKTRNLSLVITLMNFKASITAKNNDGLTPIELAVKLEAWDCVTAIVDNCSECRKDIGQMNVAFTGSIRANQLALADLLLKQGAYVSVRLDENMNTALHYAVASNNRDSVILLVRHKARLDIRNKAGLTPIDIIMNNKAWTLLSDIIGACPPEERSSELMNKLCSILYTLPEDDRLYVLHILMISGVSPNTSFDDNENTGLHKAILANDEIMIGFFIRNNARVDVKNKNSLDPVELAIQNSSWNCIVAIVRNIRLKGAEAVESNIDSLNRIMIAAMRANKSVVIEELMLDDRLNLNYFKTHEGETLFRTMLADKQYAELIQLLLEKCKTDVIRNMVLKTCALPDELSEVFEDPVNNEEARDPVLTPQGSTYERSFAAGLTQDPMTRSPLSSADLIPNRLYLNLAAYYRLPGLDSSKVPSLLKCPLSGKLFKQPVVAVNGVTYERRDIEAYLAAHANYTPDNVLQPAGKPLYVNRVVVGLIETLELKVQAAAVVVAASSNGLFASSGSVAAAKSESEIDKKVKP